MGQENGNAPKFGLRKNVRLIGRTDLAVAGKSWSKTVTRLSATWIRPMGRRSSM
jgi:hypothetical protein